MDEILKMIISRQLNIDVERIKQTDSFIDDLGADSLDIVEMLLAIEENTSVKIPDEDVIELKTVAKAVNYLEKYRT